MKTKLIENNSNNLILFLTGWGCDDNQFKNFTSKDNLLLCWDYSSLELNFDFSKYNKVNLLTYSAGVFIASLLQDKFPKFNKTVAVNGNPLIVDKEFGINKLALDYMFNLNLDNALDFLLKYLVIDKEELQLFLSTPSLRPFESSNLELKQLLKYSMQEFKPMNFDKVYLSDKDQIFNTITQREYFKGNYILLKNSAHHSPFLKFNYADKFFEE